MNVNVDKLQPGVFGVSHGSGPAGVIIRHATGSWAGHAFLYLGNNMIVEGEPPVAKISPVGKHSDAIWAWRMWDKLAETGWDAPAIKLAQGKVVARGQRLVGCSYDWPAYIGFTAEIIALRNEVQLSPLYTKDNYRTCSGLVDDAETFGQVPMTYNVEDGPGLIGKPDMKITMPPNLVAPGMLLGLAQRMDWI